MNPTTTLGDEQDMRTQAPSDRARLEQQRADLAVAVADGDHTKREALATVEQELAELAPAAERQLVVEQERVRRARLAAEQPAAAARALAAEQLTEQRAAYHDAVARATDRLAAVLGDMEQAWTVACAMDRLEQASRTPGALPPATVPMQAAAGAPAGVLARACFAVQHGRWTLD
jgi:hypothetical protein